MTKIKTTLRVRTTKKTHKFASINDAIAWAHTKVPHSRAEMARSKIYGCMLKHEGQEPHDIVGGMEYYWGHEAEPENGIEECPSFPYIWIRISFYSSGGTEWHFPQELKMEREPTRAEWLEIGHGH